MKRQPGLAPFAGHDPWERRPMTNATLAIVASRATLVRYERLRQAARFNPPRPALGGFPYFPGRKSVDIGER
jgi:hypothetical protein